MMTLTGKHIFPVFTLSLQPSHFISQVIFLHFAYVLCLSVCLSLFLSQHPFNADVVAERDARGGVTQL